MFIYLGIKPVYIFVFCIQPYHNKTILLGTQRNDNSTKISNLSAAGRSFNYFLLLPSAVPILSQSQALLLTR